MPIDTPAWVRDAVFYQIFPDRFARSARVAPAGPFEPWDAPPTTAGFKGGDLYGVVERLDELADLGITALYLNPDLHVGLEPPLQRLRLPRGRPAARRRRRAARAARRCPRRGMRVVLDGVFNHSGRGFWQFHHMLEIGRHSPYRDWFYLDRDVLAGQAVSTPIRRATAPDAPSATARGGALPALPKLNVEHPPSREFLSASPSTGSEFGIDGWRLDVPDEIEDATFWQEFRRRVRAMRPGGLPRRRDLGRVARLARRATGSTP